MINAAAGIGLHSLAGVVFVFIGVLELAQKNRRERRQFGR